MNKKRSLIALIAIILVGVSIYTVNDYNSKNKKENASIKKGEESVTLGTKQEEIKSDIENETQVTAKDIDIEIEDAISNTTDALDSTKNEKAKDFTLKNLDGKEVTLSDLKGKKIFLNFWATWCPPCISEMPEIEKLYQETKKSDLVILTVELGEPLDQVKSFIDKKNFNFTVLLDSEQSVAADYNIASIPTSYFIDEDGYIVAQKIGAMNLEEMKDNIKMLD